MIKKIAIVSLSKGLLGEPFVAHELELGKKRIADFGLELTLMPNATKGMKYLEEHPEKRAEDLITAYSDNSIDMILCAIGGDDTYRLLPHLFDHDELKKVVNDKPFLGFSDTTFNHFMLNKLGIKTFYGQAFLPDVCELAEEMLPYTKSYFEELIKTGTIKKIKPSTKWYQERTDFSMAALGTSTKAFDNQGFELLQGKSIFTGEIFGGCLDAIYDMFDNSRYFDQVSLCNKYHLFPERAFWKNKLLLLETSEEKMSPTKYIKALNFLKQEGVFDEISGILLGKPQDEENKKAYEKAIVAVVGNPELPIVSNINIGHATPRCIIPFNKECVMDINAQEIRFN